ncbi:hypothetical protein D3C80_1671480 [compost metagenome]
MDDHAIAALGFTRHENSLTFNLHSLDCNRQILCRFGFRLVGLGRSFRISFRIVLWLLCRFRLGNQAARLPRLLNQRQHLPRLGFRHRHDGGLRGSGDIVVSTS